MKKRKFTPLTFFLIRTLILAVAVVGALLLIGGVLLLCEDPVSYASVGSVCGLLIVGFVFGLCCSREGKFFFDLLSPLFLSVLMIGIGLILSGGAISLFVLLNHALFLLCFSLGRILPMRKRKKHSF